LPEWVNWVATAEDEMELISQLIGILEKLGKILFDQPYLMEIEINPVLVTTTGLIAVDALAIARSDTA
jgi:succinyl-CoA synthetase beta subunit